MAYSGHLELAKALGKELHEIMNWHGPMTHRQFIVWQLWLMEQWNKPSLTDHYLIQLDNTVKRLLAKKPNSIKFDHSKLKFEFKQKEEEKKQESVEDQKNAWIAALGGKVKRVKDVN